MVASLRYHRMYGVAELVDGDECQKHSPCRQQGEPNHRQPVHDRLSRAGIRLQGAE